MSKLMCCPLMPTVRSEPLSAFGRGEVGMLFFKLVCVNPVMLLGWSESLGTVWTCEYPITWAVK